MEFNRKNMKSLMLLIAFGIVLFLGLQNIAILFGAVRTVLHLLLPFIIGGVIAFILNVPMRAIERTLFPDTEKPGPRRYKKFSRPVSLVLTLAAVVGVLTLLIFTVWPQLTNSVGMLRASMPEFANRLTEWGNDLVARYPEIEDDVYQAIKSLESVNWAEQLQNLLSFLRNGNLLDSTFSVASSIIGGITNAVLGMIFAIYVLLQKERLAANMKKLLYAWTPERHADTVIDIARLTQKTFSKFISGQVLEACILGGMFLIAMTIFHMPYAVVIGLVIAVTALIPIFGAFIGCFLGAFLILITNPVQALWFIVLFLVLQQIEGNLIYPKVVGGSVGLPPIWTLLAVVVGGSVSGIFGIIVFIPLFSVLYALLRRSVYSRLARKKIEI